MISAVLAGFIYSLFVPLFKKLPSKIFGYAVSILPLTIFIYFASYYPEITDGETIKESYNWVPSLGITLSFLLDGLSLTFAMIISLVGFAVFLYASSYLEGHIYIVRFYVYIMIFMASMLGLVLSDNLISLFVFWELTSISSYLLIGFNHDKERSRFAALQALLITGGGGLCLLAGLIILSGITGSMEISQITSMNELITSHDLYPAIIILVLIGAFTKSAQFPFHFWLPNAMEAPTPVSAYLHSATMVKAGIYLIARMNPSLGGTDLWQNTLCIFGAITMLFTAMISLKQTDLKKLLAYSTLSVLGTLTMLIGIGNDLAIKAFMIYLIAHSLYKGTLFLVAGAIDHSAGTRDITRLGGLRKLMPVTAIVSVMASLSKMGIIPLIGFVGKETVYASVLEFSDIGSYLIVIAVIANVFIVYITMSSGFKPFFGELKDTPAKPHEVSFNLWFGPMLLAVIGLILGIFSSFVINRLINYSEIGIITEKLNIPVKLWHGFTLELFLSTLTVSLGILVYIYRDRLLGIINNVSLNKYLKPSYHYDIHLDSILKLARTQSLFLQNGYMRYYIAVIILTTVSLAAFVFLSFKEIPPVNVEYNFVFHEILIGLIIIIAAYKTVRAKTKLSSIVGLGVVGYSIAIIFSMYGAPDLAMTQFAVETLTVILFVLVMYRLPKYLAFSSTVRRIRDFTIAGLGGFLMSIMTLFILSGSMRSELKAFFAENSLPLGKGQNIVNVILVDFRALDTMGEITVLAIAALGVFALMNLRKAKGEE